MDGGASHHQMGLLGEGHDPRCLHYELGPCTCDTLVREDEEHRRQWAESAAGLAPGDELHPRVRLIDTGKGRRSATR